MYKFTYMMYMHLYVALVQEIFLLNIKTYPPHINKYNQDCPPQPCPKTHLQGDYIYSVKLHVNPNRHRQ